MTSPDLLFYDGVCGLCHRAVRFVLRHDKEGRAFRFAPIGGETYCQRLDAGQRASLPDSLLVVDSDGRIYARSAGTVRILRRLGGFWRVLGALLWLVPAPLRDLGYECIAKQRRRFFEAPKDSCPVGPQESRERFLP